MTRVAFALLLFAAPLVAAPVPKALKKAPVTLDGSWRWETQENNGKVSPAPNGDFCLWRVAGDTMTLASEKGGMRDEPCKFVSETNADGVRTFDYTVNSNGYHRRGVCELDGDTLRVAWTTHDTPAVPNGVVYVFKRVTDSK